MPKSTLSQPRDNFLVEPYRNFLPGRIMTGVHPRGVHTLSGM